jgi:DNA repair exonuclease SbcCD ATPase subunit
MGEEESHPIAANLAEAAAQPEQDSAADVPVHEEQQHVHATATEAAAKLQEAAGVEQAQPTEAPANNAAGTTVKRSPMVSTAAPALHSAAVSGLGYTAEFAEGGLEDNDVAEQQPEPEHAVMESLIGMEAPADTEAEHAALVEALGAQLLEQTGALSTWDAKMAEARQEVAALSARSGAQEDELSHLHAAHAEAMAELASLRMMQQELEAEHEEALSQSTGLALQLEAAALRIAGLQEHAAATQAEAAGSGREERLKQKVRALQSRLDEANEACAAGAAAAEEAAALAAMYEDEKSAREADMLELAAQLQMQQEQQAQLQREQAALQQDALEDRAARAASAEAHAAQQRPGDAEEAAAGLTAKEGTSTAELAELSARTTAAESALLAQQAHFTLQEHSLIRPLQEQVALLTEQLSASRAALAEAHADAELAGD